MAVKFQYNKVSMQSLQKQLKVRENALPTLKSKEAYLRVTIKQQRHILSELENALKKDLDGMGESTRLWAEFSETLVHIASIEIGVDNVAGIKVPMVSAVEYAEKAIVEFLNPIWYTWGFETIKRLMRSVIEIAVGRERIAKLEYARKKTTQKVNLYEKVQIPEFSESILKIKRFLEDVENLDKAAQKITKSRQAQREAESAMAGPAGGSAW